MCIGFLGKKVEIATYLQSHLGCLLGDFPADRVNHDVGNALLSIVCHRLLQQLGDVGIETATQAAVASKRHKRNAFKLLALHV